MRLGFLSDIKSLLNYYILNNEDAQFKNDTFIIKLRNKIQIQFKQFNISFISKLDKILNEKKFDRKVNYNLKSEFDNVNKLFKSFEIN